jgi:hypothetical protein
MYVLLHIYGGRPFRILESVAGLPEFEHIITTRTTQLQSPNFKELLLNIMTMELDIVLSSQAELR